MQPSLQYSVSPSENLQNFTWVFEYHYKAKQSSKTNRQTQRHKHRRMKTEVCGYICLKTSMLPDPDRTAGTATSVQAGGTNNLL